MTIKNKIKYCYFYIKQSIIRYKFDQEKYLNTFLDQTPKNLDAQLSAIPLVIFCFWTGNNEMSGNRKKCLKSIKANADVPIKLITPQNLSTYILDDFPLHEGFQYLSLVHKSDYLRCYFMHFYGGGYSDIKICMNSWRTSFEKLENSNMWLLGYNETRSRDLAIVEGQIGSDMKRHFLSIIGNGAYICRPNTSFTKEWYDELIRRMDFFYPNLKQHPGNVLGDNEGYPIEWTNILGSIFHPLNLKYMEKIYKTNNVKPSFQSYR